ncbi:MAG: IS6 family transposase, partial [Paracoccaceae bacterium]
RYPLSYRDVRDMLAERGITVDAASIHRWVRKFGPEIRKRARSRHRAWRGLIWHVDETYIRSSTGDGASLPAPDDHHGRRSDLCQGDLRNQ